MARGLHLRKNDTVVVISGDDRGMKGKVLKAYPLDRTVIVAGVNNVKRTLRKSQQHPKGGIVEKELPIPVSKVMLVCEHCGKPSRTMYTRIAGTKDRGRVCKKCRSVIVPKERK